MPGFGSYLIRFESYVRWPTCVLPECWNKSMDIPGSHQPPKKKRDPKRNKEQQKRYRQRLYAAPNGIEEVKAMHRRRYYERMDRLKVNGEYEAFKAKKTEEGMRRYHAMTEEQRNVVKR